MSETPGAEMHLERCPDCGQWGMHRSNCVRVKGGAEPSNRPSEDTAGAPIMEAPSAELDLTEEQLEALSRVLEYLEAGSVHDAVQFVREAKLPDAALRDPDIQEVSAQAIAELVTGNAFFDTEDLERYRKTLRLPADVYRRPQIKEAMRKRYDALVKDGMLESASALEPLLGISEKDKTGIATELLAQKIAQGSFGSAKDLAAQFKLPEAVWRSPEMVAAAKSGVERLVASDRFADAKALAAESGVDGQVLGEAIGKKAASLIEDGQLDALLDLYRSDLLPEQTVKSRQVQEALASSQMLFNRVTKLGGQERQTFTEAFGTGVFAGFGRRLAGQMRSRYGDPAAFTLDRVFANDAEYRAFKGGYQAAEEDEMKTVPQEAKERLQTFYAERRRYKGLLRAMETVGTAFPFDETQAQEQLQILLKGNDSHAARDFLACMDFAGHDVDEKTRNQINAMARIEDRRRQNREIHEIDQDSHELVDEVATFYVDEYLLGKELPALQEKLNAAFIEDSGAAMKMRVRLVDFESTPRKQDEKLWKWVREYLVYGVAVEIANQTELLPDRAADVQIPEVTIEGKTIPGETPADRFVAAGTPEEVRQYLYEAMVRFDQGNWGGIHGGKAWGEITRSAMALWSADKIDYAQLDHIIDLQHNTGTVFSKREDRIHTPDWTKATRDYARRVPKDKLVDKDKDGFPTTKSPFALFLDAKYEAAGLEQLVQTTDIFAPDVAPTLHQRVERFQTLKSEIEQEIERRAIRSQKQEERTTVKDEVEFCPECYMKIGEGFPHAPKCSRRPKEEELLAAK